MRKINFGNGAASNSLLLTFVQVITTVLGIIVTKLLSVCFSLQEYGTYSQALLITTTATSISILGLTNATNYFYNRTAENSEKRKYIATIFTIQYIVGVAFALAIIAFRFPIALYLKNNELATILPIVAFTPFLQNLISMYQVLFVSIGEATVIAIRNLLVSLLRLLAVLIACFLLCNITAVLVVILGLDVIQAVYFFILFGKHEHPIDVRDTRFVLVKEILTFSIPMSVYVLTNSMSRDIDKYVISIMADTETLAIYTNAAKILPFDMLTSSLITVLIPIITRMINQKEYGKAKDIFKLYLRIGYILTFIFVGGAIAVSKNLMLFLYDEKYLIGLPIFIIYLLVDMIRFANVTTILSGAGKTKILMIISLVTLGLNAIFNVLGYRLLGLIGPALVTLGLTFGMTIALLHFGAKEMRIKIIDLFFLRELICILVQIIVVGFLIYSLSIFIDKLKILPIINLITCYSIYIFILGILNYRRVLDCFQKLDQYK